MRVLNRETMANGLWLAAKVGIPAPNSPTIAILQNRALRRLFMSQFVYDCAVFLDLWRMCEEL